jgi:hypothetical protein
LLLLALHSMPSNILVLLLFWNFPSGISSLPGGDHLLTSQVPQVLTPPSAKDWCGDWGQSRGKLWTEKKNMSGGVVEENCAFLDVVWFCMWKRRYFLKKTKETTQNMTSATGQPWFVGLGHAFATTKQENRPTSSESQFLLGISGQPCARKGLEPLRPGGVFRLHQNLR